MKCTYIYAYLSQTGDGTNFLSYTKNINRMLHVGLEIGLAEGSVIKICLLIYIINPHTKQMPVPVATRSKA